MDRIERKRQLKTMLGALKLSAAVSVDDYEMLLKQLDVQNSFERDILRSVLTDAVFECRRRGVDDSDYRRFLNWLG